MASLCHPWCTTTNLSYRFPIFEASATALCGTTGIHHPHLLCPLHHLHLLYPFLHHLLYIYFYFYLSHVLLRIPVCFQEPHKAASSPSIKDKAEARPGIPSRLLHGKYILCAPHCVIGLILFRSLCRLRWKDCGLPWRRTWRGACVKPRPGRANDKLHCAHLNHSKM